MSQLRENNNGRELLNANVSNRSGGGHVPNETVTLLVDNQRFTIERAFLSEHPNTMLGAMFGTGFPFAHANENGDYEVAEGIPCNIFAAILEYYRRGYMTCPPGVTLSEFRTACDYLLIPFHGATIMHQNLAELLRELSNEAARQRFELFIEKTILPKMIDSAQSGYRDINIVILVDSDVLDTNDALMPRTNTNNLQIIHNTIMSKILKFEENRSIAKQLLREHGFTDTVCDIEWFPVCVEKKVRIDDRMMGLYTHNYVPRPHIIISLPDENAEEENCKVVDETVACNSVANSTEASDGTSLASNANDNAIPNPNVEAAVERSFVNPAADTEPIAEILSPAGADDVVLLNNPANADENSEEVSV